MLDVSRRTSVPDASHNRDDTKRLLGTRYASSVLRPSLLLLCWLVLQVQSSVAVRSTVYDCCCCCIVYTAVEDLRDIGRQIELCLRSGGKYVANETATEATAAAGEGTDGDDGDCRSCAAGETSTQTVIGS